MTAEQLIAIYGLSPLPGEGGYFRRFYTHGQKLEKSDPHLASAIFYLITKNSFSATHRLPSGEFFHFYEGHPAQMLQLDPTGNGRIVRFGPDQERAMVVPGGFWQGMRLEDSAPDNAFALFGVSVHPDFRNEELEIGDRAALCAKYPE